MLILVNANRLRPPIAPIGLDYVASAARAAGLQVEVVDLGLSDEHETGPRLNQISGLPARLVGVTMRNVDDCFWPSAVSYVDEYIQLIRQLRQLTDAPIVVGGVGFSIFGQRLLVKLAADFGLRGDAEQGLVELYRTLEDPAGYPRIAGLIWREGNSWREAAPGSGDHLTSMRDRASVDHVAYFRRSGQIGIETKRGCPRHCIYCADPVAKGRHVRFRSPEAVADEFETLADLGIDVVHLCDGEFNVPRWHALAVCNALIRRDLASRVRFYTYMAVRPFDAELAHAMKRAGCVGINFTGDSAANSMLQTYRAAHRQAHLGEAVAICRSLDITCMVDLLLGGPGETIETLAETIQFLKRVGPDCVGAALGLRLYPETLAADRLLFGNASHSGPGLLRRYAGPIDLTLPTFYVSPHLGARPATVVRELIAGDPRFFPPTEECGGTEPTDDHNYGDNAWLANAIALGARGAYWDILRTRPR